MKKILIIIALVLIFFLTGFYFNEYIKNNSKENINKIISVAKPLEIYTIDNLSKSIIKPGKISINEALDENDKYTSYLFTFEFYPNPEESRLKKMTGMINIPKEKKSCPLILMLRGYVDQKIYKTGAGTKNASYFFADKGYITIAPDFLGYNGSDNEAENIFESRFQTYTSVLTLLHILEENRKLQLSNNEVVIGNIGIWGHSNGGQIALTILEITQKNYPTVLWAPVSKPFPYSILYYTDESEDKGKLIRQRLAKFEETYDVEKYSLTNYFERINKQVSFQIHQGNGDEAVPIVWTNSLVKILLDLNLSVEYFIYNKADHNLKPSWDMAIERSETFFQKQLKN